MSDHSGVAKKVAPGSASQTLHQSAALTCCPHATEKGTAIPIPAGPFGGTTLVVVPATAPRKDRQAWQELAQSGAMQEAHGRFHRLLVAFEDEAPRLGDVLGDLHEKGRNNVLIVPAMFCAGPDYMRELRKDAAGYAPRMTLTWLPGLGGSVPAAVR